MTKKTLKVVKIHDVNVDRDYMQWLGEIKSRYRSAQAKASVHINVEQLIFNWQLGRDLVEKKAEERWGAGVVEQVSLDLQAAFPESKGFSVSNLWRMKQWYLFFSSEIEKLQQAAGELHSQKLAQLGRELRLPNNQVNTKLHQVGGVLELPAILSLVPWRHHIEIISKCKSVEEALFYLSRIVKEGWSRNTLINCIKADLYHTSGGAITNFADCLPSPQSELAQAITKDTYDFGFLTLEPGYIEESLETELELQRKQAPVSASYSCRSRDSQPPAVRSDG